MEDTSDHRRSNLLQLPGGPGDGVPGFQEGKLGRHLVELRPNMWKTSLKKITTDSTDPTRRRTASAEGQIPQRWGGFPAPPDLWVGLVRSRLKVETTQRPRGRDACAGACVCVHSVSTEIWRRGTFSCQRATL